MDYRAHSTLFFAHCSLLQRARKYFGDYYAVLTAEELFEFIGELHHSARAPGLKKGDELLNRILESRHKVLEDLWQWRAGVGQFQQLKQKEKDNIGGEWEDFFDTIGSEQAGSWKMINEWLTAAYYPQSLYYSKFCLLFSAKLFKKDDDSTFQHRGKGYRDNYILMLKNERTSAMGFALCQSLAHCVYISLCPETSRELITAAQHLLQNLLALPGHSPWLTNMDHCIGPAYLWSAKKCYACISHTWGRWKDGRAIAKLEGCPWNIPRNTIWDVAQIPEQLAVLGQRIGLEYIWFDLVCIPQTTSGELGRIAQEEIARQASIFRGSSICVSWLSYIDNWEGEKQLIEWLSLIFLELVMGWPYYPKTEQLLSAWEGGDIRSNLLYNQLQDKYLGRTGNGKISSSNDELCLCPDMILMSWIWELLNDPFGRLVTLEKLANLLLHVHDLLEQGGLGLSAERPGLQEQPLTEHLFEVSPLSVNVLDLVFQHAYIPPISSQSCITSRAEAIMSAISIVDWYKPGQNNKQDLILRVYPAAFVNKAAPKIGREFALVMKDFKSTSAKEFLNSTKQGLLLPFDKVNTEHFMTSMSAIAVVDSEWLDVVFESWEFLLSGLLRMRKALIVGKHVLGKLEVISPELKVYITTQADPTKYALNPLPLEDWLRNQPSHFCTFAIAISKYIGIVLSDFGWRLRNLEEGREEYSMPLLLVNMGAVAGHFELYQHVVLKGLPFLHNSLETLAYTGEPAAGQVKAFYIYNKCYHSI
ncbi:hypothetical protein BDV10DRAFT_195610 [Aspergillus recurvatus]